jgi:FkbM family methyltransferase
MATNVAYDVLFAKGGEFFETLIEALYKTILRPGDHVIDVGANRGRHTVPMSEAVGHKGRVIAIEAIPQLAEALRNMCLSNVQVYNVAAGDVNEQDVDLYYVTESDGLSSLRPPYSHPWITAELIDSTKIIKVNQVTIDTIIPRSLFSRRVSFIKMDIESGEYYALQGAIKTIKKFKPMIVFENGMNYRANQFGYEFKDVFNLFDNIGYEVFDLFGREIKYGINLDNQPWYAIATHRVSKEWSYVKSKYIDLINKTFEDINLY